jgi:hypothetical protein
MSSGDHQARLRDEHARSHEHLRRYHGQNPGVLSNADTYRTAHGMMTEAQRDDLEHAGLYDPDGFRKLSGGRDPSASEIHDKHLEARTHSVRGVRQVPELIDHVHGELKKRERRRDDDGRFR